MDKKMCVCNLRQQVLTLSGTLPQHFNIKHYFKGNNINLIHYIRKSVKVKEGLDSLFFFVLYSLGWNSITLYMSLCASLTYVYVYKVLQ